MNFLNRAGVKTDVRVKSPNVPEWMQEYKEALGNVFYVVIVLSVWVVFLFAPAVPALYLIGRMAEIPANPVHGGGWMLGGIILLSIFWYTLGHVLYKKHEVTRLRNRKPL